MFYGSMELTNPYQSLDPNASYSLHRRFVTIQYSPLCYYNGAHCIENLFFNTQRYKNAEKQAYDDRTVLPQETFIRIYGQDAFNKLFKH